MTKHPVTVKREGRQRRVHGANIAQAREAAELRSRIVDRWLKTNDTHRELGAFFGIERSTVSHHLRVAQDEWKESALASYEEKVRRELAKLDKLEGTLWEAWERSCKDAVVTTSEVIEPEAATKGSTSPRRGRTKISERREGQVGDPRYLTEILACVELRAKVLGLITKKVEHGGRMEVVKVYVDPEAPDDASGADAIDELIR